MESRLSQIENSTLASFLRYKPADKRVDEKLGSKDGKLEKPDSAAVQYPFRLRAITEAQAGLQAFRDRVDALIADMDARQESLQQDLDERYARRRNEINAEYQDQLEHLENKLGPNSARHRNVRERLTKKTDEERRIEADLGRPLRTHLLGWYAIIMVSVALIEIPINRFAFELYFAETPALSLFIALGVGLALMILVHLGGIWLKRSTGKIRTLHRIFYVAGLLVNLGLIMPTIFLIALLRQHYVHFVESQQVTFAELLQQEGLGNVAREVLTTDLGTQGWMLFMINLLVVAIGLLASVVRHDSHPDYERIVRTKSKLERRLMKLKAKFEAASAKTRTRYEERLSSLDKQQERIEKQIGEIETHRLKCTNHTDGMLGRVALHVMQRLHAYEAGNEAARKTASPAFFWNASESDIKDELEAWYEERPDESGTGSDRIRVAS